MANFLINRRTRRTVKSKTDEGKRSDSKSNTSSSDNNFSCKKHTKHRQSPGICSLCLTERLSKLSVEYYYYTKKPAETSTYCGSSASSSSSVTSCYYSSSVSSCSSPLQYRYREKKKDGKKQSFLFRLLLRSIVD
ncbi:PREDICTED: uncharacterized protein LOC104700940 [Camelina sativa]|uniref:Uncharacterized protein LOC104700940 n=1 Tax=Camelina sativa TaxID=90675 RepID=A0ABM0SQX6_CAMSA|nr:PREDICTED: uncharacterized protein LOC104700940 [Camelina sativa]